MNMKTKIRVKLEKKARKNFEKAKNVPYSLRVKNLNSGDTEW